jgi:hypothetical protein
MLAMLDRGWRVSDSDPDVLVHPQDHALFVRYDPATDTLGVSPALDEALALVIVTPAGQTRSFWRKPAE